MKVGKPETLGQALKLFYKKRVQLCIGSRGSFFFIGTAEEFDRDLELLESHYRAHNYLSEPPWKPFKSRAVKTWYKRKLPLEPMPQLAIIVEGAETGECVCWSEYARSLPEYYMEYLRIRSASNNLNGPIPKTWTWEGVPQRPAHGPVTPYDDDWRQLLDAIVIRATEDYKALYRKRRMRRDRSTDGELALIEDFLSGGYLMSHVPAKLRKLVEDEL